MEFLERVLDSLALQQVDFPWEVRVIDSGSTDGTWESLRKRAESFPVPFHVKRISQPEFDHGDTRNELAAFCEGDLLVFLTQDAIPSNAEWLARLAKNFTDPKVGAAYSRNVARADANLLTKVFCRNDPGYSDTRREVCMPNAEEWKQMSDEERRVLYNFNNVASAIRRDLWEVFPFPRTMMGEDVLMGRGILEGGYIVVYDSEATVDHSHDYGYEKTKWRGFVDSKFNAEWLGRINVPVESDITFLREELVAADMQVLERMDLSKPELSSLCEEALSLREAMLRGMYEGGLSRRRYPSYRMRDTGQLRVLVVLDNRSRDAASQARASGVREIAKLLAAWGHSITFLQSSGVRMCDELYLDQQQTADGVQLVEFGETTDDAQLEAAFQGLLLGGRPDLVHFHGFSPRVGWMLSRVRRRGIASLVSLYDGQSIHEGPVEALHKLNTADLRVVYDTALRDEFLAALDFDPQTFAFCVPGELDPEVGAKSIEEEARELQYRYRSLSSILRVDASEVLLETLGSNCIPQGEVSVQGEGWLLLRPLSSASIDLPRDVRGDVRITIVQASEADEELVLGGRVWIDEQQVATLDPIYATNEERLITQSFDVTIPAAAQSLRMESRIFDAELGLFLRICKVTIARKERDVRRAGHELEDPAPSDLGELARSLEIDSSKLSEIGEYPRVSVVVPNLNGHTVLKNCLDSIEAFDFEREKLGVILVDNGSQDGSVEWVRRNYPRIQVIEHERNLGFAAACNAGARAAESSEIVVFLNNDMWFERGFLHELLRPLLAGGCAATTAKLLSADGSAVDTSGTGSTFAGIAVQPGYGQAPLPHHDVPRKTLFPCGGAMAIDAAVFQEIGGFDEEYFAYYEDLDLGWRMWLMGHEVHYAPRAVGYHLHSHTSERFPPEVVRLVMIRNSLYTCVKNYDDRNLARVFPVIVSLAIRRAHLKSELDHDSFRIENARLGWSKLARFVAKRGIRFSSNSVRINRMGAADLIAINDLLSDWEHWMQRREEVQSRRKRSDEEIQRMFLDPLACVEGDPTYASLQDGLVRFFGLDSLFPRS